MRERNGVALDRLDAKVIAEVELNLARLCHNGVLIRAYTIDSPKC